VEHQLPGALLVRAGYVGSKGTHLGYNSDINAPFARTRAPTGRERKPAPTRPKLLELVQDIPAAIIYNSLQASVEKRFAHGSR